MNPDRYSCPCCGHLTYAKPAAGTMQLCPVCFWEDAPGEEFWNGSNSVCLVEAQRNFSEFGACEKEFLDSVRHPHPGEERPADWASFEQSARNIIDLIEGAFAEVKLEDGITIHQREAIDGYQSAEEIRKARSFDKETRWQDIAAEKIRSCGTTLTFHDPKSVRYHLPAFMRYAIKAWLEDLSFGNADFILYSLNSGPRSNGYHADSFLNLDGPQKQSVAAFLKFASLVDPIYGDDAAKGLQKGWVDWLPDSPPFSMFTNTIS